MFHNSIGSFHENVEVLSVEGTEIRLHGKRYWIKRWLKVLILKDYRGGRQKEFFQICSKFGKPSTKPFVNKIRDLLT